MDHILPGLVRLLSIGLLCAGLMATTLLATQLCNSALCPLSQLCKSILIAEYQYSFKLCMEVTPSRTCMLFPDITFVECFGVIK